MFKINDNYLKIAGKLSVFHHCKKKLQLTPRQIRTRKSSVLESAT